MTVEYVTDFKRKNKHKKNSLVKKIKNISDHSLSLDKNIYDKIPQSTWSSLGRIVFFLSALIRSLSSAYSKAICLLLTSLNILQST